VASRNFSGRQPSGDTGQTYVGGQLVRKKLIAWINSERTQVKVALLYNNGQIIPGTTSVLRAVPFGLHAFQTVTAWSPNDSRWLVAWTEHNYPTQPYVNGIVYTRYVNFEGTLGTYVNGITYCAGDWDSSGCGPTIADEAAAPLQNNSCKCMGLWLASSYYSGSTQDRYRLHQYNKHAQLSSLGIRQGDPASGYCGGTWSPITEAGFWYDGNHTPFQCLSSPASGNGTNHRRLVENDLAAAPYEAGQVFPPYFNMGQAFRADGSVAVALATNEVAELRLSIVDVRANGCPP